MKRLPEARRSAEFERFCFSNEDPNGTIAGLLELAGSRSPTVCERDGSPLCTDAANLVLAMSLQGHTACRVRLISWLHQDLKATRDLLSIHAGSDPIGACDAALDMLASSQPLKTAVTLILQPRKSPGSGAAVDLLDALLGYDDIWTFAMCQLAADRIEQPISGMREVIRLTASRKLIPSRASSPVRFGHTRASHDKSVDHRVHLLAAELLTGVDRACLASEEATIKIARIVEIGLGDYPALSTVSRAIASTVAEGHAPIKHLVCRVTTGIPRVDESESGARWADRINDLTNGWRGSTSPLEAQLKLGALLWTELKAAKEHEAECEALIPAVALLVAIYSARLCRKFRCQHLAQDIAQDALLSLLRSATSGPVLQNRHAGAVSVYLRTLVHRRLADRKPIVIPRPRRLGDYSLARFEPAALAMPLGLAKDEPQLWYRATRVANTRVKEGETPVLLAGTEAGPERGTDYLVRVEELLGDAGRPSALIVTSLGPCRADRFHDQFVRARILDLCHRSGSLTEAIAQARCGRIPGHAVALTLNAYFSGRNTAHNYAELIFLALARAAAKDERLTQKHLRQVAKSDGIPPGSLITQYKNFCQAVRDDKALRAMLDDDFDGDPDGGGAGPTRPRGDGRPTRSNDRKSRNSDGVTRPPNGFDRGDEHPSDAALRGVAIAVLIARRSLDRSEAEIERHAAACDGCYDRYEAVIASVLKGATSNPRLDNFDAVSEASRSSRLRIGPSGRVAPLFRFAFAAAILIVLTAALVIPNGELPTQRPTSHARTSTITRAVGSTGQGNEPQLPETPIVELEESVESLALSQPVLAAEAAGAIERPESIGLGTCSDPDLALLSPVLTADAHTMSLGSGLVPGRAISNRAFGSASDEAKPDLDPEAVRIVFEDGDFIVLASGYSSFFRGVLGGDFRDQISSLGSDDSTARWDVPANAVVPWILSNADSTRGGKKPNPQRLDPMDHEFMLRALLRRATGDTDIAVTRSDIMYGDAAHRAVRALHVKYGLPPSHNRDRQFLKLLVHDTIPRGIVVEASRDAYGIRGQAAAIESTNSSAVLAITDIQSRGVAVWKWWSMFLGITM